MEKSDMGLFYTNIAVYGSNRGQIVEYLTSLKRIAYISPTVEEFTVIYDRETEDQDTDIITRLAESVSKKLRCVTLASLVHDSDIYIYWLYQNGKLVDGYNSAPDYFESDVKESTPKGGNPYKLCEAFDRLEALTQIKEIFSNVEQADNDDWEGDYLFGEDIHYKLAQGLGMPLFAACTGFYTIENSELPEGLTKENLIKS